MNDNFPLDQKYNEYNEYNENLTNFFTQVFQQLSDNEKSIKVLVFSNLFISYRRFDVNNYLDSRKTIEIIQYIDFIFSLFTKIMNCTFKINSYYPYPEMFEIINNNYIDNSSDTILMFLQKKYPDIKFFKGEFALCYPDKLLISKI